MRYVIHIYWVQSVMPERHCSTGDKAVAVYTASEISKDASVRRTSLFDNETGARNYFDDGVDNSQPGA